jgi:Asp-tRNA(Asn)/Glu-tRNA(Gln) amidotransferase A subunit family amidase
MEFRFQLETYLRNTPDAPFKTLQEIVDSGLFHESLTNGFNTSLGFETLNTPDYRARLVMREQLRIAVLRAMADSDVDALVYPTITRKAVPVGESQPGSNCQLSGHTGLPAISVPGGFTPDGMPVGVELLGRPFDDAKLLGLAYSFEQATHHRRPPASTPVLAAQ